MFSFLYKKRLLALEVQIKEIDRVIQDQLKTTEFDYLDFAIPRRIKKKEKDLEDCKEKLDRQLKKLKAIKAGKSNSFVSNSIRYNNETYKLIYSEHERIQKQYQDLQSAIQTCNKGFNREFEEEKQRIQGGESEHWSHLRLARKNLGKVQEAINNELDRLMESPDEICCLPYFW